MSQYEIIKSGLEELLEKTRTYRTSGQSAGFFETLASSNKAATWRLTMLCW